MFIPLKNQNKSRRPDVMFFTSSILTESEKKPGLAFRKTFTTSEVCAGERPKVFLPDF